MKLDRHAYLKVLYTNILLGREKINDFVVNYRRHCSCFPSSSLTCILSLVMALQLADIEVPACVIGKQWGGKLEKRV